MKISLITATFNSSSTLCDTIKSVLAQSYQEIEYIVVDGLSKDSTVDIIKEYEPYFKGRMKWISEKDNGLYDAINKGIRIATGDVVGILNSDDFFTSTTIVEKVANSFTTEVDAAGFRRRGHRMRGCRYSRRSRRAHLLRNGVAHFVRCFLRSRRQRN